MTPRLIEAVFYPAGTHEDPFNRSYTAGLRDRNAVDRFLDATKNGRNINNFTMASIAENVLTLSAEVDENRPVEIPNGWGSERLAFTMLIETDRLGDQTKYQLITGFTDRADISHGQHLAPDTRLFINNTSSYRDSWNGRRRVIIPEDNSYLLRGTSDLLGTGRRRDREDDTYYVRPSDIYYHLSGPGLLNKLSGSGTVGRFDDMRSRPGAEFAKTRRSYDSPATFLAQTIRAGLAGRRAHEDRPGASVDGDVDYNNYMGEQGPEDRAASILESQSTAHNEVFRRLLDASDFIRTGGITVDEFEDAVDCTEGQIRVWELSARRRTNDGGKRLDVARRGETRRHNGADDNTMAAEMGVRIASSLLHLHHVGCAVINISNDTWDNEVVCRMTGVGPIIDQMDISDSQITAIEEQLRWDLGSVVSNNGAFRFNMRLDIEMNGTCWVKVWVEDPNEVDEFSFAVYADCLTSSQISHDDRAIEDIAGDVSSLLDALDDINDKSVGIVTADRFGNYN